MPKPTACWVAPLITAARVGLHIAVTWKPLYFSPPAASRSSAGVRIGPPKVPGLPKPASSVRISKCSAHPSGGERRNIVPVRLRAVQRPLHHPPKRRTPDRQLGAVDRLVAHVLIPPVVVWPPSRPSASLFANTWACPRKSGLRLVGGILTPR